MVLGVKNPPAGVDIRDVGVQSLGRGDPLRRARQPILVVLLGESYGQRICGLQFIGWAKWVPGHDRSDLVYTHHWATVKRIWSWKGLHSVTWEEEHETWFQIMRLLPTELLVSQSILFTCFLLCEMGILTILYHCWENKIRQRQWRN